MADKKQSFRKRLSLQNQAQLKELKENNAGENKQEEPKPSKVEDADSIDPFEFFKNKNKEEITVKDPMKFINENNLNEEGDKPKLLGSLANDEKAMLQKIQEGGDDLDLYEDVVEEKEPVDEKALEEKNEKMKKRMQKVISENKKA